MTEAELDALDARLRDATEWLCQDKDGLGYVDHSPFEAADALFLLRARLNAEKARKKAALKPKYSARHVKRGTTYDVIGEAHVQTDKPLSDMDRVVVYRCRETGHLWARRYAEFIDGRFEIKQEEE